MVNLEQIEARDSQASGDAAGFPEDDEMRDQTVEVGSFQLLAHKA